MKNLKSTEPIFLNDKYGWTSDIYDGEKSSYKTDICTVWGKSKEELERRVMMICKIDEMAEALKWFVNAMNDGSLIVFTDDDQHKAVRDDNQDNINKIELLVKQIES